MHTNIHLSNLGVPDNMQLMNWAESREYSPEILAKFAEQKEKYGFDERETYELCDLVIEFIYARLKMLCEVGYQRSDMYSELDRNDEHLIKALEKFKGTKYKPNDCSIVNVPDSDIINYILNAFEEWIMARENEWDWDWYFSIEHAFELLGRIIETLWW